MSIEYNAPEANKGRWISIGQKVGATALAVITSLGVAERAAYSPGLKPFEGQVVVSVGDSIAAGYGNTPYMPGTEDGCARSVDGAAANALSSEVENTACQGATLDNMMYDFMYDETETQMEMLERVSQSRNIDMVVLSAGINEKNLGDVLESCLGNVLCEVDPAVEGELTDIFTSSKFKTKLKSLYTTVTGIAPKATVAVTGYAKPVDCAGNVFGLVESMGSVIDTLNQTIREAAESMENDKIVYVEPPETGTCSQLLTAQTGMHMNPFVFTFGHPDAEGQLALSKQIVKAVREQEKRTYVREVRDEDLHSFVRTQITAPSSDVVN